MILKQLGRSGSRISSEPRLDKLPPFLSQSEGSFRVLETSMQARFPPNHFRLQVILPGSVPRTLPSVSLPVAGKREEIWDFENKDRTGNTEKQSTLAHW